MTAAPLAATADMASIMEAAFNNLPSSLKRLLPQEELGSPVVAAAGAADTSPRRPLLLLHFLLLFALVLLRLFPHLDLIILAPPRLPVSPS